MQSYSDRINRAFMQQVMMCCSLPTSYNISTVCSISHSHYMYMSSCSEKGGDGSGTTAACMKPQFELTFKHLQRPLDIFYNVSIHFPHVLVAIQSSPKPNQVVLCQAQANHKYSAVHIYFLFNIKKPRMVT